MRRARLWENIPFIDVETFPFRFFFLAPTFSLDWGRACWAKQSGFISAAMQSWRCAVSRPPRSPALNRIQTWGSVSHCVSSVSSDHETFRTSTFTPSQSFKMLSTFWIICAENTVALCLCVYIYIERHIYSYMYIHIYDFIFLPCMLCSCASSGWEMSFELCDITKGTTVRKRTVMCYFLSFQVDQSLYRS